MRIVIAPDKFKGCLDAPAVADAIAQGVLQARPDAMIDLCPVSDGGEGFVETMLRARGGKRATARVVGPLPEMHVDAAFGLIEDPSGRTAIIEMSAASGIALLQPQEHNPEATTTFGTGQLLVAGVEAGCRRIILGIGGSATIDGGLGCCHAAGLPVLLEGGEPTPLTEPLCGRDLPRVVRIKSHRGEKLAGVDITVACDVTNPLCGPNGAARVFGPQKGATPEQVELFDRWLDQLARRCDMQNVAARPGAGAAGGMGFAMMAFFGASLRPGAEIVIEAAGLRDRLTGADLCITGEGTLDSTSRNGKAPVRIAQLCAELGVPCVAIVGKDASEGAMREFGQIRGVSDLANSPAESIRDARRLISAAARELLKS